MAEKTWFGTRGFETWIPTFATSPDYSRTGYSSGSQQLMNGYATQRESKTAHNVYVVTWRPTKSRDTIRLITDFADGVFDSRDGNNLIYWIDPMAADKNVLNQGWATPSLATEDGIPLVSNAYGSDRPEAVTTPANIYRYPARGALYTQNADSVSLEQYIPIPPGYVAWVGITGEADAAGVFVVDPVDGYASSGPTVVPAVLSVTSATLVNTAFSSVDQGGIVLRVSSTASTRTFTIYGLVVQILPIGVTPVGGNFISGQGHSGCQFVGKPSKTPYSSKLDRVGASARLEEMGMAF